LELLRTAFYTNAHGRGTRRDSQGRSDSSFEEFVPGGESSGWGGASSAGTAYSSLAHAPKSMSLQRSEQKGR
jgi:hypothetical protein